MTPICEVLMFRGHYEDSLSESWLVSVATESKDGRIGVCVKDEGFELYGCSVRMAGFSRKRKWRSVDGRIKGKT